MPPSAALTVHARTRLIDIRADISARLWPVNTGMSSASFNQLLDEMSLLQLRFELGPAETRGQIDSREGPSDRRAPAPAGVGGATSGDSPEIPGAMPSGTFRESE
jgi:hypothetical protein